MTRPGDYLRDRNITYPSVTSYAERADWLRPMKDWEWPEATKKSKSCLHIIVMKLSHYYNIIDVEKTIIG